MITVVMTTYDDGTGKRFEYARQCIDSIYQHMIAYHDHIRLHITDDGSDIDRLNELRSYAESVFGDVTGTRVERRGIGGSLNVAIQNYVDDLWLYTTDDWLLTGTLDLTQAVRLIRENSYDYVRVGPPHPELLCRTKFQEGIGWWLEFVQGGTGFVFATRPFIATRSFFDKIGPFVEDCDSYVTEREYSDRVNYRAGNMVIKCGAIMHDQGPWEHIGEYNVGYKFP